MSSDKRPSPVQPPVTTRSEDNMAQVQRGPNSAPFSGRPDAPPSRESALPPIQGGSSHTQSSSHRPMLPPMQLRPSDSTSSRQPNNPVSITSLLSSNPESPKGRKSQRVPQFQPPSSQYDPSRRFSVSPSDARAQMPSHPPARPHFLDGPPMPMQSPPHPTAYQYAHQQQPQMRRPPSSMEPEQVLSSPATSVTSFGQSYYSHSGRPSPELSTAPSPRVSQPPPFHYALSIRQQPHAARACGFGERDRRVVDPPPILELKITDIESGRPEQDYGGLLALHCTLLSHKGSDDETEVPPAHDGMPATRRLMGTLVASPYQAKDEHGVAGTFFVFPDLSCRSPGKFRLRFKLLRVDPTNMQPGSISRSVASIVTTAFSVYTAKDFPGMRASSALLKSLRRQGLNVGVKKGSEARKSKGKSKKEESSGEEDDDDDDDESDGGSEEESVVSPKKKHSGKRRKRQA